MEEKENWKIRRTKQLLSEALIAMLRDKPLHRIPIRELCEKAGVNRTTFYNHYGSQYDLLDEITGRFLSDISGQLASADPDNRDSVQERIVTVFTYLEEHLELSRLLLNNTIDPHFAEKLFSMPKITDLLSSAVKECPGERHRKAAVTFAVHGSYRLLLEWLNREDRETPEDETALVLDLARKVCSNGNTGSGGHVP